MLLAATAQRAVGRHGECYTLAPSIGGATLCFPGAFRRFDFTTEDMAPAAIGPLEQRRTVRHAPSRVAAGSAHSWTGRATTSRATDSHLSTLRTAGTRMTRVSAVRALVARAAGRPFVGALARAGAAAPQRRGVSGQPPVGG